MHACMQSDDLKRRRKGRRDSFIVRTKCWIKVYARGSTNWQRWCAECILPMYCFVVATTTQEVSRLLNKSTMHFFRTQQKEKKMQKFCIIFMAHLLYWSPYVHEIWTQFFFQACLLPSHASHALCAYLVFLHSIFVSLTHTVAFAVCT